MRPFQNVALISFLVVGGWLLATNHVQIFPVRNTLQFHLLHGWWDVVGYPADNGAGRVEGTLTARDGTPLVNAVVLATRWDGSAFHTRTDMNGAYELAGLPQGYYAVLAGVQGYTPTVISTLTLGVNRTATVNATLLKNTLPAIAPKTILNDIALPEATQLTCDAPVQARAERRAFTIRAEQSATAPFYLYTPIAEEGAANSNGRALPVLLTLYPGAADGWDCVSVPLAAAGYAVIALGTTHRLDLEEDVVLVKELLAHLRAGHIADADPTRMVVLGGSYSAFHAQRLLQDEPDFRAGILLGAPTDLFDMRRRYEHEGFVPPYGLDQAIVALGFPDREPLRYWQYSGAFHVHSDIPPLLLVHSRTDEIVPYPQSTLLAEQLDAVGVPYELHFFDGASHYLLEGDSDALAIYDLTLAFLREHL